MVDIIDGTKETKKTMWSDALHTVLAWTKASRWRKAAKCKSLIKQIQHHLIIQRNRRETIIRQSRADIAQLLQHGQLQNALDRVEQLYKDQCLLSAYDQIDHLCGCIIANLSHISKQSDVHTLPSDVRVAVSSLIFAASRCGELPELHLLRNMFKERYGSEFVAANVESLTMNLVDPQIKQNLCINLVPDDVKLTLISEIAKDFTLHLGSQDLKQPFKLRCQEPKVYPISYEKCMSDQRAEVDACIDNDEYWTQASKSETPRKMGSHFSLSNCKDLATIPGHSPIDYNGTIGSSRSAKIRKNAANVGYQEALSASTSLNGRPGISDMNTVYLDDIEEKSLNYQEDFGKIIPNNVYGMKKNLGKRNLNTKSALPEIQCRRSSTWDSLSKNHSKMLVKDRLSFDGSFADGRMQQKDSPGHVHPKLPDYEDVVAKLVDFKTEYSQRNSFSYL